MLGWVALLELITGLGVAATANPAGQGGWLVAAALLYAAVGAALGAALDPWLRAHPATLVFAVAGVLGIVGAAIGSPALGALGLVGASLAWFRWRFPGRPSRARTGFRVVFVAGLVLALVALGGRPVEPPRWSAAPATEGPSLLVVVLDTVRRDHLSTYGYERDTSPVLDALAARGTTFPGFANACWSLPGHATMFTGRYAGSHGAHYESGRMNDGETTVARVLEDHGYDTLTVTGNPWIHRGNGLGDDFGTLVPSWTADLVPDAFALLRFGRRLGGDKGGAWGVGAFEGWLDARPDPERPFFAVVNVFEAHAPYHSVHPDDARRYLPEGTPRARAVEASEALLAHHLLGSGLDDDHAALATDLYDGAVRGADRVLGQYLDALDARGLTDDTVVVVTSDHGEYLGEHGLWGHVHGLFEPVLQVPFVMAGPGVRPGVRADAPARLVDLAPTLLAHAGVPRDAWPDVQGRAVSDALPEDPVVAEQFVPVLVTGARGGESHEGELRDFAVRRRSLRVGEAKLHAVEDAGRTVPWRLFDLGADPGERIDLSATHPDAVDAHRGALDAWADEHGISWPETIGEGARADGFEREALEALGYVQ